MIKRIIFLLFIAISIVGCETINSEEEYFASVRGVVKQVNTDTPISGVTVHLDSLVTTTSESGSFSFSNIPFGPHTLSATKPDFEKFNKSLVLEAFEITFDIDMAYAIQSTTLSGSVTDTSGNGLAGATLVIFSPTKFLNKFTKTDSNGNYLFEDLYIPDATNFVIRASRSDYNPDSKKVTALPDQTHNLSFELTYKPNYVLGEVIIGLENGVEEDDIKPRIEELDLEWKRYYKNIGAALIGVPVGEEKLWVEKLKEEPMIWAAQLNHFIDQRGGQ